MKRQFAILILLVASFWLLPSIGQETAQGTAGEQAEDLAEKERLNTADKSGTNPINFQTELRFFNEYSWLNTAGDGNQDVLTMEYRAPLDQVKKRFQLRTRLRYAGLKADLNNDGSNEFDTSGLGDIDFRILSVPWTKGANAFAYALEFFLNTASEPALGTGATAIAPRSSMAVSSRGIPCPSIAGAAYLRPVCSGKSALKRTTGAKT